MVDGGVYDEEMLGGLSLSGGQGDPEDITNACVFLLSDASREWL